MRWLLSGDKDGGKYRFGKKLEFHLKEILFNKILQKVTPQKKKRERESLVQVLWKITLLCFLFIVSQTVIFFFPHIS